MLQSANKQSPKFIFRNGNWLAGRTEPRPEQRELVTHNGPPFTTSDIPFTMPMNLQTTIKQQLRR